MDLLIDIGNSRIKMADMDNARLSGYRSCAYHGHLSDETIESCLNSGVEYQAIWIASVGSDETNRWIANRLAKVSTGGLRFIHPKTEALGVSNVYEQAERLGVDRWLGMIAAYHYTGTAVCVADCGSALTVDLLDQHGQHHGGLIVPGRHLQAIMLANGLAQLPTDILLDEVFCWGRSTREAISSGGVASLAGAVTIAMSEANRILGNSPRLVLTGGDALLLGQYLSWPYEYYEHLVLDGLALCANDEKRDY